MLADTEVMQWLFWKKESPHFISNIQNSVLLDIVLINFDA